MFVNYIEIIEQKNSFVSLLERLFTFKVEGWKESLLLRDIQSEKYHLCLRLENLKPNENLIPEEKLVVRDFKTEVWSRDDEREGIDFVLVLILE